MSIILSREGRAPEDISFYRAIKLLAPDTEPWPVLRRLGQGEMVAVRLNDGTEATMTLNTFPGQRDLNLPAREADFAARCILLVPLPADVRCRATDAMAARQQIYATLKAEQPALPYFQVIVDTDRLDELWYGIDHDRGLLRLPFRHIEIDSIDEVRLLRGPAS